MQISVVTGIGVALALFVARNITFTIFSTALLALVVTYFLAYKHQLSASIYLLITTLSLMLFALAITGAGIFDLAALGFPGLLVFAATLGGGRLFSVTWRAGASGGACGGPLGLPPQPVYTRAMPHDLSRSQAKVARCRLSSKKIAI